VRPAAPSPYTQGFGILLRCLYPATPHIAHSLWQGLGFAGALGEILEHPLAPG
jgi:leucyl-tRNA synthetase